MLLFLGFDQASHGGYNIWYFLLESPSIGLYVIIFVTEFFSYGISGMIVRIPSIISIMGSHNWTTTCLSNCNFWRTAPEGDYDSENMLDRELLDAYILI